MVVLGTLIGGMVIAMYLPIFKLGARWSDDARLAGSISGPHYFWYFLRCSRPAGRQLPQRRYPSPAKNDG